MAEIFLNSPFVYIFFGFLPSIIWLFFYLREEVHPEPNWLIIQVFALGMLSAGVALGLEFLMLHGFELLKLGNAVMIILGVSIIEEYVKYLVVKIRILRDPDFDVPVDAMLYMIIAALGFAAVENILFIAPLFQESFSAGLSITILRFLGATMLHGLASGLIGFGIASAILHRKPHGAYLKGAFIAAVALHAAYNYLILVVGSGLLVGLLLLGVGIVILQAFKILRHETFHFSPYL
jgi:RsiW-degrading membrane proteinase PrsW (M82 family)